MNTMYVKKFSDAKNKIRLAQEKRWRLTGFICAVKKYKFLAYEIAQIFQL
jgi:hypothetical protein